MLFAVFDVSADLAQFKKPFTTMSPQTFSIPTGTACIGMISAIIGLDKNEYWKYFPEGSYQLAIGVRTPVKKTVIPINLLKTTSPKHFARFESRKPSNVEFIKNPAYRLYFSWENFEKFNLLSTMLEKHLSHYSLSLGQAGNLANFSFVGLFDGKFKTDPEWRGYSSILRQDKVLKIGFGDNRIFSNRIPVSMRADALSREVTHYNEYLFDGDGKEIVARMSEYIHLGNGENIVPI
ncbi:MAG: type I-B CRISPR-associated protein Cas5b [Calditrichaceae bacterium]